jgi:hypothetical protein
MIDVFLREKRDMAAAEVDRSAPGSNSLADRPARFSTAGMARCARRSLVTTGPTTAPERMANQSHR